MDSDLTDKISKTNQWETNYSIDEESLERGDNVEEGFRLYTDGSKIGKLTGYGAALLDGGGNIIDSVNCKLSDNATVFQAECVAMDLGLTLLRGGRSWGNYHNR